MATKTKCPKCGAKNALDLPRCRVCTTMLNHHAAAAAPPAPSRPTSPLDDHFDAAVIDRQLQPARSRFGSSGGGLSARIAAANGGTIPRSVFGTGQTPVVPAGPSSPPGDAPFEAQGPAPASSSPAGPASLATEEFEPFDADALFRDMGSPS